MKLRDLALHAEVAAKLGHWDYAVAAAEEVLRYFPYHIRARSVLGQALLERGHPSEAAGHFEAVLELDPENILARSGLALALEQQGQLKGAIAQLERAFEISPGNSEVREALLSLRSQLERVKKGLELTPAARGKAYVKKGEYGLALQAYNEALAASVERTDTQLARAEALWRSGRKEEAQAACRQMLSRSPRVIKAKLLLGLLLLEKGDQEAGCALIHEARTLDPSDSVAAPLLDGTLFQLPDLENALELPEPDLPLPAQVKAAASAGTLGEEHLEDPLILPASAATREGDAPLGFRSLMEELSVRLAGGSSHSDGERGSYLILSSRRNLTRKYGEGGFLIIDRKLGALREALQEEGFQAYLVYVDEEASLQQYGIRHLATESSDQLRALIADLEVWCQGRGLEVNHILLVGNDDVLPFCRLGNPAEDEDPLVLSDAPYSGRQSPLLPQRSVSRIPDSSGPKPTFLLSLLDSMIASQRSLTPRKPGGLLSTLVWGRPRGKSFGYVALVWKEATQSLLEEMGDPGNLHVCPPVTLRSFEAGWLRGRSLLLFNLHGTANSAYWYGQKDGTYPADYPLFPVALTPELLAQEDLTGAIVFTEACYGLNLLGRTSSESLALRLLERGAACVVGSTQISYGSLEPPLTGADLLAKLFWTQLLRGASAGEALSRAKLAFLLQVRERQGYLDGDDQKTVLSFLLLGDPEARLPRPAQATLPLEQEETLPGVPLFCKQKALSLAKVRLGGELLAQARRQLSRVAPEAADCELQVLPRTICAAERFHICSGSCAEEGEVAKGPGAYLVTSQKSVRTQDGAELRRVARLTLDSRGSILKVSISK